jgi:tetratricopeptide (TPR) repeat protein
MKRTERHRLKENEVALSVARAKETFEIYRKPILAGAVALVVVLVAIAGIVLWRQQVDDKARMMLADAMAVEQAAVTPAPTPGQTTPPPPQPGAYPSEAARDKAALEKFQAAANAYPSSKPGIAARYHAAATLAVLGRNADALKEYQEVVNRAGANSLYGEMAKLGMADVETALGQYDQAIAHYSELANGKDPKLPTEGVLMQLARAYEGKGAVADARKTFKRIVDEFPQSPYAATAKREMDGIKG